MIEEVRLPEISENVEFGDVIKVLVKTGDFIEKEQSVVELETEKAAFEVPSPVKGKVTEVNVKEGDNVKVGQVILKVDTEAVSGEKSEEPVEKTGEKEETEEKSFEKKEIEQEPSEKEPQEQPEAEKHEAQPEPAEEREKPSEPSKPAGAVPAAPSVRQLARELGVDIGKIRGTGASGRISAEDVKNYAKNIISGTSPKVSAGQAKSLPDFTKWGEVEREQITTTRRKIADTLSYTWSNVPQVTQYDKADITGLEKTRNEFSKKAENVPKLTITSIALKIVASALKEFPKFNASFDTEKNEIIYKKYVNISVAVETDRGLLVPVIRDADKKDILQLSNEMNELAEKARQHKVTPDDMVGGNFTVSNLGGIGGTGFAPVIYFPQVAILGISRAEQKPVCINSRIEPRLILPLSISYDHRIVDGVEGLRFLRWIVKFLENPFLLTLDKKI